MYLTHFLLFFGLDLAVAFIGIIAVFVNGGKPDDRSLYTSIGLAFLGMLFSGTAAIALLKDLIFLIFQIDPYYLIGAIWRFVGLFINILIIFLSLIRARKSKK